jgi:hypothetical protein
MQDLVNASPTAANRSPWNKGKLRPPGWCASNGVHPYSSDEESTWLRAK